MNTIPIGRLLRSSIKGCVVGCNLSQATAPAFGQTVLIPLDEHTSVFGLVYDIHIDDDGLVRQLITANGIDQAVIEDNRINRNVPLEISVVFIGFESQGKVSHLLPFRPPLTLDAIYPCASADLSRFISGSQFSYLRHFLTDPTLPAAELLAVHLRDVLSLPGVDGEEAVKTVISTYKDDYPQMMNILSALSEIY